MFHNKVQKHYVNDFLFELRDKIVQKNVRDARSQKKISLGPIYNHAFQMQEIRERQAEFMFDNH